jgi:hypothetical protein
MQVTKFNVGSFCLSEDECIAQKISFAAYERGVSDAADVFDNSIRAENEKLNEQVATLAEQNKQLHDALKNAAADLRGYDCNAGADFAQKALSVNAFTVACERHEREQK